MSLFYGVQYIYAQMLRLRIIVGISSFVEGRVESGNSFTGSQKLDRDDGHGLSSTNSDWNKMIYVDEAYMDILVFVYGEIAKAPHIKSVVYQDKELLYFDEKDAAGINTLREQMKTFFGDNRTFVMHEELINRLD
jgi:hypothetical protein